jgi:putative two-component system response regulator
MRYGCIDRDMTTPHTILIVAEAADTLSLMQETFKESCQVQVASSDQQALEMASTNPVPALIFLQADMPGMDGFALIQQLRSEPGTAAIPVLAISAADAFLKDQDDFLEQEVARRTRDILAVQDATILAMAALAEIRDADTGNHTLRIQHYVRALARKLSRHPRFASGLTPQNITLLFKSTPLHDIGKVGIPDRILLKPGKLTPEEFEIMKTHTTVGRQVIDKAEQALQQSVPLFAYAKEIAYSHHEKWDGTGYPEGLAGEQIPLSARLMALADVYDALISRRVYKEPTGHEQAVEIIRQTTGRHFDPDVVDAFLEIQDTFKTIAIAYSDEKSDLQKKADYIAMVNSLQPD